MGYLLIAFLISGCFVLILSGQLVAFYKKNGLLSTCLFSISLSIYLYCIIGLIREFKSSLIHLFTGNGLISLISKYTLPSLVSILLSVLSVLASMYYRKKRSGNINNISYVGLVIKTLRLRIKQLFCSHVPIIRREEGFSICIERDLHHKPYMILTCKKCGKIYKDYNIIEN